MLLSLVVSLLLLGSQAQICNNKDPDSDGLLVPAFGTGGGERVACTVGVDGCGTSGVKFPENDPQYYAILYFILLLYMFLGVGAAADRFMEAIEVITSKSQLKEIEIDGRLETVEIKVWNDTVANLTLMALGSSAPEILLSIIEILSNQWYAGDLGPGTIVGSAAFNLFMISAVCVASLPGSETRRIKEIHVFCVTAFFSIFAYIWIVIILVIISPDIIELWEGLVTFLLFPVLCGIAYMADKGYFKSSSGVVSPLLTDGTTAGKGGERLVEVKGANRKFGAKDVGRILRGAKLKAMNDKQAAQLAAYKLQQAEKQNPLMYRLNAQRTIFGKRRVLVDKPIIEEEPIILSEDVPKVGWASTKLKVMEDIGTLNVRVIRSGPLVPLTVEYATKSGTAREHEDYVPTKGTLEFARGQAERIVSVKIINDEIEEEDEQFTVHLANPVGESNGHKAVITEDVLTISILDDDKPGMVEWSPTDSGGKLTAEYSFFENCGVASIKLHRFNGYKGEISVHVTSKDGTAVSPTDYVPVDEIVTFRHGEYEKTVEVRIVNDEDYEKDEHFTLVLSDPSGGCELGGIKIAKVIIVNDDEIKSMLDRVTAVLSVNLDQYRLGHSSWQDQFEDVFAGPEPDSNFAQKCMFVIAFPFSLVFAFIPPSSIGGGWPTFCVALMMIGLVTALIGDFAGLLGCSIGLKDAVTAITFVALGTSLPDTFASRSAALNDPTADNSIGNITGSNSVNVFLGLGLPWFMAAVYWEINFDSNREDWALEYPDLALKGKKGFAVPAGSLGFGVIIFCILAINCICVFLLRRKAFGYELGGRMKYQTATLFTVFWVGYVVISSLQIYDIISDPFA